MRRLASICLSLILLCALAPGLGEIVENGVHLIAEHHLAHDAPQSDEHEPLDREHGCTSTAHLCSCHVSQTFLCIEFLALPARSPRGARLSALPFSVVHMTGGGIDHPPRA